jgi:hypothetical protein
MDWVILTRPGFADYFRPEWSMIVGQALTDTISLNRIEASEAATLTRSLVRGLGEKCAYTENSVALD